MTFSRITLSIISVFSVGTALLTGCEFDTVHGVDAVDAESDEESGPASSLAEDSGEPTPASPNQIDLSEGAQGTIDWPLLGAPETLSYVVEDGLVMTGGDMVLGTVEEVRFEHGLMLANMPSSGMPGWPGNVVPYWIDPNISNDLRGRIEEAVERWNEDSVFFLRERTSGEYSLIFREHNPQSNPRCRSEVGYKGNLPWRNSQSIYLVDATGNRCSANTIVHEIGHTLGLAHEHQRSDRNNYITVDYNFVNPVRNRDFDQHGYAFGPYNFTSLMHYDNRNSSSTLSEDRDGNPVRDINILVHGCTNDTDPGCRVGRESYGNGDVIITDGDIAGVMRANHGSKSSAFRLRNLRSGRCLRADSNGYVEAGNAVRTSSCSNTSTRRWYQTNRPGQQDTVLVNRRGRVCLKASPFISPRVSECDDQETLGFEMYPLGDSRYLLKRGIECLYQDGSTLSVTGCFANDYQTWEKLPL